MFRRAFLKLAAAAMIHPAFNWGAATDPVTLAYAGPVTMSVHVIWIRVDPRCNLDQLGWLHPEHHQRERPAG